LLLSNHDKLKRIGRALLLLLLCSAATFAQGEASGGHIPKAEATRKEIKTPSPNTSRPAALDRIDGRWWTTGNDFGPSSVEITQDGANVSGVIRWADGRTGSLKGTLVGKRLQHTWSDSNGNGGTGWLELSWANFLGGPWHNQTIKNGSWTLNRIEGQWCFGGDKKRPRKVTHDAKGQLRILTEDGSGFNGHLEGPWIYLDDDEGQSIKGDMFYKGNRINFANGSFWTWCGR